MNSNTAAPSYDQAIQLSKNEARRVRLALEAMAPPVGEPVDYEDCLLLGIWWRLSGANGPLPPVPGRSFKPAWRAASVRPGAVTDPSRGGSRPPSGSRSGVGPCSIMSPS